MRTARVARRHACVGGSALRRGRPRNRRWTRLWGLAGRGFRLTRPIASRHRRCIRRFAKPDRHCCLWPGYPRREKRQMLDDTSGGRSLLNRLATRGPSVRRLKLRERPLTFFGCQKDGVFSMVICGCGRLPWAPKPAGFIESKLPSLEVFGMASPARLAGRDRARPHPSSNSRRSSLWCLGRRSTRRSQRAISNDLGARTPQALHFCKMDACWVGPDPTSPVGVHGSILGHRRTLPAAQRPMATLFPALLWTLLPPS